jgi:hypothetical protein
MAPPAPLSHPLKQCQALPETTSVLETMILSLLGPETLQSWVGSDFVVRLGWSRVAPLVQIWILDVIERKPLQFCKTTKFTRPTRCRCLAASLDELE